jgi:hypothetical protein
VARRVVTSAVTSAQRYEDLVDHLAGFVLDPERQEDFRRQATNLRHTIGGTAIAAGSQVIDGYRQNDADAPPRPPTTTSLSDEVLEHAQHHLAHFVGPIASMLVEQAAEMASDRDHFHSILAEELDDESERSQFLANLK